MNHYLTKARRSFSIGVICACGAVALGLFCVAFAFAATPCGAIGCACLAVFCGFGASIHFTDARIYRIKASWWAPIG